MMTTGKVFGEGSIHSRPEFGGVDPRREQHMPSPPQEDLAAEQLRLEQNKNRLLQDAIAKFLNKEITKVEFETIQESLK